MTLVVAVSSEKSIWLLADRRISYQYQPPKDDARKLLFLETIDGNAILGYAGLGITALGTEPSDWMSRVLRGHNLTLEESLGLLADASREKLPEHLETLPISNIRAHHIIIPAFVKGEPRLYSIDLVRPRDHSDYLFRYTQHLSSRSPPKKRMPPRIAYSGSGAKHLQQGWDRKLLRILTAYEGGRISLSAVANAFAQLNNQVADKESKVKEPTVGKRCIVAWRFQEGGGGHAFFDGTQQETDSFGTVIPTIGRGWDINAIVKAILPLTMPSLDGIIRGEIIESDRKLINAELAKLPHEPDDKLS